MPVPLKAEDSFSDLHVLKRTSLYHLLPSVCILSLGKEKKTVSWLLIFCPRLWSHLCSLFSPIISRSPPMGSWSCFLLKSTYCAFFPFIFISWRLITLQYCSGFCHTLTWISHGFTCIPHPDLPSHLPLHPVPLGLPSAPAPNTCLMHPTWAGDLFHPC